MTKIPISPQPIKRVVAIASIVVGCLVSPIPTYSQSTNSASNTPSLQDMLEFNLDLSGRGSPRSGNRTGGASRSLCGGSQSGESLFALIPDTNVGLTVEEHPTFWFYVPDGAKKFHSMKFALWSDQGEKVYETTYPVTNALPGVMSITLPPSTPALKENQYYNWIFTVYCEDPQQAAVRSDPRRVRVRGSIQRVPVTAELQQELNWALTPRDRAIVLARNGIWFDSLTLIGNLRRTQTANYALAMDWINLLEDIELDAIASKPITECCSALAQ
ncbi:MAG: DUF928 domain-containing protein [Coleofasciculus sp. D1-CHI-01]|mgnify:CR=1 FL=1|uniref:DUF928 domain-containing protein n=1 Tax=Coleofasciculus sp. D1-CHI-01 TaxID=3068482 RepID=UPI0032FF368B